MTRPLTLFLTLFPLLACQSRSAPAENTSPPAAVQLPTTNAPEINTPYGWLNTDKSYSISDFKGKFLLLDFWTFGCINCQHIIPDLKRLEKEYAAELVVVGVHSAKFDSEKNTQKIREAILKFGIEHPVVNDADYTVWNAYAVKAWPTVVLIAPDGKVVGQKAGEGVYAAVKPTLEKFLPTYTAQINRQPMKFGLEKDKIAASALKFPSKMIRDGEDVWFSDSGHNRILKINREGKILETIGQGSEGFVDGTFAEARFYEPHGLARSGNYLYIADTKNNRIRRADLTTKKVETVAGDGTMGYYFDDKSWGQPVNPNSPWDLLLDGNTLFIANAGNHQVLQMDLSSGQVFRFAGTGREALVNGTLRESAFNQPSGLSKNGDVLYVADAEASAVRAINLRSKEVSTIFGTGLFDFGDKDGPVASALMQHCVGLEYRDGKVYVADTYNGKIKVLDLAKQRLTTLVAGLNEPNDILFLGEELWIADTNNHQLVRVNIATSEKQVVAVQ